MRIFSFILLLLVMLIGVTFAMLNSEVVNINYYIGKQDLPLSLLLAIVFSLGCLLGLIVGMYMLCKAKFKAYQLNQRLNLAEKEIENLRAIPLQDKH